MAPGPGPSQTLASPTPSGDIAHVETVSDTPALADPGPGAPPIPESARLTPREMAEHFQASYRVLWCIAAGVVNERSRAEDIVQEAAMIALAKLDQFDRSTSFTAWAGQIVRFVALNEGRKKQRETEMKLGFQHTVSELARGPRAGAPIDPRGSLVTDQDQFDDEVLGALKGLEETARACLLLRTTHDLPYSEIALIMGIPEGTAMSHVHRSRTAMRKALAARGYAGSGAA